MASGISSAPSQMPTATGVWWAHCEIWFSSSVDPWAYTYVHFPISVGLKYYQLRHLTIEDRKGMKRQFNTIVIIYVTFLSVLIFIKTFISSIMTGDLKTVFTIPMSTEPWEFSVKASAIPPCFGAALFSKNNRHGAESLGSTCKHKTRSRLEADQEMLLFLLNIVVFFLCFDSPTTAIQVCSFGGAHILTHTHMARFCRDRNPSSPHSHPKMAQKDSRRILENFGLPRICSISPKPKSNSANVTQDQWIWMDPSISRDCDP